MKLFVALFALAAAQDGDGSQGAADQAQGADQGATQGATQGADQTQASSGYGEEQQTYGGEYAGESYGGYATATAAPVVPTCCVSACPVEAPFFNPTTCSCVVGYVAQESYASASYGAPVQTYGQSYGEEAKYGEESQGQQSGYRKLQEFGDAEASFASTGFTSGPEGTIDTRNLSINRTGLIVLWVAFGILFLLACYYLRMFHWYYTVADSADNIEGFIFPEGIHAHILHFLANPSLIAGCVCLIASLAYLTMATNNGWYTRCHDGRQFFFARYIDWVITTPLMLHALAHFANAPDEIWNFLFFSDVLMIVSGLIASTIDGPEKWIYYGFAVIAFIPVLYYICKCRDQMLDNRLWDSRTGLLTETDGIFLPYFWFFHNYQLMADLTVLAWFLYPIVWIFAEGTNKLSVTGEAITYTILDLISKGIFGWFIVHSQFEDPRLRSTARMLVKD